MTNSSPNPNPAPAPNDSNQLNSAADKALLTHLFIPFEHTGTGFIYLVRYIGALAALSAAFFRDVFDRKLDWYEVKVQCEQIGIRSLPIATVTLLFVGLVFSFQFGFTLSRFGATPFIGKVTGLSMVRELAPVFTALVVGGRVGAGIAAEIGSMRVTEQIDAISALGASPYKKLLVPRVLAAVICVPIITLISFMVGILGAMFVAWAEFKLSPISFYNSVVNIITFKDFFAGFFKPFFFGYGIALIGCYEGFNCELGTVGVGKATTRAVVSVSLMIVFVDFFLTRIFAFLNLAG